MRLFTKSLIAIALLYCAVCIVIYAKQKQLLFPTQHIKPVPASWQPTAGDNQIQAFITGQCGKLHVAKWNIQHAKGTIMMFHGNGESLASIDEYAYAFHQLGYNLMAWDYPGYGQSTDCWFSQQDLLSDAETAYQWLSSQEKPEKIFIFGYSLGTGLALAVESKHQQNPVYLVAAYDALVNVAKDNFSKVIPVDALMRYPMRTETWVLAIKQPIYMIHGTNDQLIRPERSKHLVAFAPQKVKLEMVNGAGHAEDTLFLYRNQWLKRLLP
jgi:uncharacterized protein